MPENQKDKSWVIQLPPGMTPATFNGMSCEERAILIAAFKNNARAAWDVGTPEKMSVIVAAVAVGEMKDGDIWFTEGGK